MSIIVHQDKAIEVAKERLRVWRVAEFAKNDLILRDCALGLKTDEEKAAALARRQELCDITTKCDGITTTDELKAILAEVGA